MSTDAGSREAVVLIAHGTVENLDDLPAFLTNIRRGHAPPPELLTEVRRRYEAIGGRSPLLDVSRSLAKKLEARLAVPVRIAMRLFDPYPKDVLVALAAEGRDLIAVVPLAQHSAKVYGSAMEEAAAALETAAAARSEKGVKYTLACADNWGRLPALRDAFVQVVRDALAKGEPKGTTLLFTAHSLPKFIIDSGDPYETEVRAAAQEIATALAMPDLDVQVCFQSQGIGAAAAWLGPDLQASLRTIKKAGQERVVIAPIGFLADHVEILYDLDIEAAAWAKDIGLSFSRTRSLNDADALVGALAEVARPLLARLAGGRP
jgi:ferrochelatase